MAEKALARERCYEEIILSVQGGLERYYREFPERLDDARSKDAHQWSMRGADRILKILDKYEISDRAGSELPPNVKEILEGNDEA